MHRTLAVAALILVLAACSLLPGAVVGALNGEWQLQAGTSQGAAIPLVAKSPITLKIDGTKVGGTAACNSYGGTLQIDGTTIKISELFQTEMACLDDRVMASEAAYLAALSTVVSVAREGNSLVLSGPGVELRFALVPPVANADLVGTAWVLDSLINGEAVSSVFGSATLQLNADGTLSASTGCRTVSGHYTIAGNQVEVTLQPWDAIGCANDVGAQDAQVLAVIGGGFAVVIQGNTMTLTSGGQGLGYGVGAAS